MIDPRACICVPHFSFDREGKPIPACGTVEIEDDVHVLPFATIAGGTERPTRIRRGARIDCHVHVAHDCDVGPLSILCAGAVLAGFVVLEANVYVGIGAVVKQRLRIGANSLLGAGAVVVTDIPPNSVAYGNPARVHRLRFDLEPDMRGAVWSGTTWEVRS